jgi:hypothetical protein
MWDEGWQLHFCRHDRRYFGRGAFLAIHFGWVNASRLFDQWKIRRMVAGPIAVVIVSVLVLWVSGAPVSLIGILFFIGAALPTWLILHALQARVLSALARRRSPWMPPAFGVTQSRAALDSDTRDPAYWFAVLWLGAIKWALVVTAGYVLAV